MVLARRHLGGRLGRAIVDNDVDNTRPSGESGGEVDAVYVAGVREAIVANNRMTDASIGFFGQGSAPTWGTYRDNITVNVAAPYTGGTDIRNNNRVSPRRRYGHCVYTCTGNAYWAPLTSVATSEVSAYVQQQTVVPFA